MKNAKILIVDDNAKDLKLLTDYLTLNEYSVVTAQDGEGAFSQLQTQTPDLVILDINMPDLSGWKTCDKIKNDPLYRHVPVLMCSASIEDDGHFSAYQTGDAYIQKPVNLGSILTTIQKLLSKKSSSS
jgi:CheY-like chemotaxis protein